MAYIYDKNGKRISEINLSIGGGPGLVQMVFIRKADEDVEYDESDGTILGSMNIRADEIENLYSWYLSMKELVNGPYKPKPENLGNCISCGAPNYAYDVTGFHHWAITCTMCDSGK